MLGTEDSDHTTPAPGFRDAGNEGRLGALEYVGHYGFSWSSTANDTRGIYLHFNATNLNLRGQGHRAYGFQLRCLSE